MGIIIDDICAICARWADLLNTAGLDACMCVQATLAKSADVQNVKADLTHIQDCKHDDNWPAAASWSSMARPYPLDHSWHSALVCSSMSC